MIVITFIIWVSIVCLTKVLNVLEKTLLFIFVKRRHNYDFWKASDKRPKSFPTRYSFEKFWLEGLKRETKQNVGRAIFINGLSSFLCIYCDVWFCRPNRFFSRGFDSKGSYSLVNIHTKQHSTSALSKGSLKIKFNL